MNKKELIKKIIQKKQFSKLPKKDVELAFSHFEKREVSDNEKIRLTRELLHKVFGAFSSKKLLSPKNKDKEWILRKHLSTRERLPYYENLYKKLKINENVIDLGAGINGFSYNYFNKKINYLAIESMGQLIDLMNSYFKREKLNAFAIQESLFELEKIKKIIKKQKKPRIVFLFKVLDSLEMLEKDYSKKLLKEIVPLVNRVIVSFALKSMAKRQNFKVNRNWIVEFIKKNFQIIEDFEMGDERYVCFESK